MNNLSKLFLVLAVGLFLFGCGGCFKDSPPVEPGEAIAKDTVTVPVVPTEAPEVSFASELTGCDSIHCFNNYSCAILPNTKFACQCVTGYLYYTDTTGTEVHRPFPTLSGIKQAGTGWDICRGSEIGVCLWKIPAPFCEGNCYDLDLLVNGQGEGKFFQYNLCAVNTDTLCINLGNVYCCQPTSNNCRFTVNPNWAQGLTPCENCRTGYSCTAE